MNFLITGGAGFIGSTIARRLLAMGHSVRVLDNLKTSSRLSVPAAAEFVEADIRTPQRLLQACAGIDVVLHQAAMVSVPLSVSDPYYCFEVNVQGTRNVLRAAAMNGCKRVVLASSAAIYGNDANLPKRESMPQACASPYAYSKWLNELDAEYYSNYCGLETACLRYFNVFGPGQRPDSPYSGVISIAAKKLLADETFTVFGTGEQSRDFVFVEDVAGAAIAAALTPGVRQEVVNVGRGEALSLLEMLGLLGEATGRSPKLSFVAPRDGDVMHSIAEVSKLKDRLNFNPAVSVREGISKTLGWMQNSSDSTPVV